MMIDIELTPIIPSVRSTMAVNYETVPLRALQPATRETLTLYLDANKVLPSPNGYSRDWRGLLEMSGLTQIHQSFMSDKSNPTMNVINILERDTTATFASLRQMICDIDRWDVFEDTDHMFYNDANMYLNRSAPLTERQSSYHLTRSTSLESMRLTMDDEATLQRYDAFVLFEDHDSDFAKEIIDYLHDFQLKVCYKDRFLGGINFEHAAIRTLLTERCNRLIVILSPHFINSPLNEFISNFAQSLGIAQRKRKIIPISHVACELPPLFQNLQLLDYQRSHRFSNFWHKLRLSIKHTEDHTTDDGSNFGSDLSLR